MSDVSPIQGQESIVPASRVSANDAHSSHRSKSRPILYSQFRGPKIVCELTDEEKAEAERKKVEDEEKKSNFKRVQEDREAQKARADAAEQKLREREEADKKAADAKLAEEKRYEELAKQKEQEAAAKAAEASTERAAREKAEAELAEFKKAQHEELDALVAGIPEADRPPLPETIPVPERLKIVKHTLTLLGKAKRPVGGAHKASDTSVGRKAELLKKGINALSADEALELAGLSE